MSDIIHTIGRLLLNFYFTFLQSTLSLLNEARVYDGQNKCKEGNKDDKVICEAINEGKPDIKLIEIVDYIV